MSGTISALQSELAQATYITWVTRICQVAVLTLVLYDHVITLDQEIKYIWKRFCLATVLYVIIRYVGDALVITSTIVFMAMPQKKEFCNAMVDVQGWLLLPVLLSTQVVLLIRIYALCRRSKKVLAFMLVFYVAEIVALVTLVIETIRATEVLEVPYLGVVCTGTTALASYFIYTVIGFEGLLFITLLWLAVRHSFNGRLFFGRSLFETLVRGNVFYFLCILTGCLFDVIIWKTLGDDWLGMPGIIADAVPVIAGCRLILNLHASIFRDTLSEL